MNGGGGEIGELARAGWFGMGVLFPLLIWALWKTVKDAREAIRYECGADRKERGHEHGLPTGETDSESVSL